MANQRNVLPRRWIDEIVEAMRRSIEDLGMLRQRINPIEPKDPRLINALIVLGAVLLAWIVLLAARDALLR